MKRFFIITGSSRGIGAAMARALIHPDHRLFCLSRGSNPNLQNAAAQQGCALEEIAVDLSQPEEAESCIREILSAAELGQSEFFALVNNAATLDPVLPVGKGAKAEVYRQAIQLNLLTPMILTEVFLQLTNGKPGRRILNISSGAASNPYAGWSSYCSSKAGLEMFARTVALEQIGQPNPARIMALAPGVVDTDMQTRIREVSTEDFPKVERFVSLKNEDGLSDAGEVGQRLASILLSDRFGDPVCGDLRKMDE